MASVMKSINMISTTGFSPESAPPTEADTIVDSEIGVSLTRASPNSSSNPLVALKEPPAPAMSSPSTTTLSSSVIASFNACATAWAYRISLTLMTLLLGCIHQQMQLQNQAPDQHGPLPLQSRYVRQPVD